jgi:branched-chain amino acid transport system substrate-binding protein
MAQLKRMPIHDFYSSGRIRQDGRYVHDMYLFAVKTPDESKGDWDLLKKFTTIPGDVAFNSLAESTCPLVKK